MAEINGWRGLQNLAERKTGRIAVSVAERWRCCLKRVTGHLCYVFIPVGLETLGSWGTEAWSLIRDIGRKLTDRTGEARATCFLVQKISIELQRGNACSVLGTFPALADWTKFSQF